MASLGRGSALGTPLAARVARALVKQDPRSGRQPLDLVHCQDERTLHHSMQQQFMLRRIDVGNSRVMALKVDAGWGKNALRVLQGRLAGRCLGSLRVAKRALRGYVFRRLAVSGYGFSEPVRFSLRA